MELAETLPRITPGICQASPGQIIPLLLLAPLTKELPNRLFLEDVVEIDLAVGNPFIPDILCKLSLPREVRRPFMLMKKFCKVRDPDLKFAPNTRQIVNKPHQISKDIFYAYGWPFNL